ncbi:MAG: hypothetical protein C4330_06455 [Chitinophagaceae bacterium]
MEKQILQFCSLLELASFSRQIDSGYVINTQHLTLTGLFTSEQINISKQYFGASIVSRKQVFEKVY